MVTGLTYETPYYWRVQAGDGRVLSPWSATRSFTTIQLPAPALLTPADGSAGASPSPTLTWATSAGAAGYTAQVALNAAFTTGLSQQTAATPAASFTGLHYETLYYWRVQASDGTHVSPWSAAFSFTTALLPAPALTAPSDASTGNPLSLQLNWSPSAGATGYTAQVDTTAAFPAPTVIAATATTCPVNNLAYQTTYYWRVQASDGAHVSPWSAPFSFATLTIPAPTLTAPADGATGVATAPTLTWSAVPAVIGYTAQLATNAAFTAGLQSQNVTALTATFTGLANATTYYWRAQATDGAHTGAWSAPFSFTTSGLPAPVLTAPADAATEVTLSPTFTWNPVPGATDYDLQLATDSAFTKNLQSFTALAATTQAAAGLTYQTTYYWRARANAASYHGPWATRSFASVSLAAPTLLTPANGAIGDTLPVTLTWQAVPGADTYTAQTASDAAFTTPTETAALTAPTLTLTSLTPGATYYWRVKAVSAAGDSPWSAAWSFATALLPAAAPTFAPPAGAVAAGTAVSISSTTPGALISYSTDGGATWSTPAASPVSYTVTAAVTLQAKASAAGYTDSAVSQRGVYHRRAGGR